MKGQLGDFGMSQSWIKLWRILFNKPIWLNSTPQQKVVLITLMGMANAFQKSWEWGGKPYKCEAGQFVTSLEGIQKRCGKGVSIKNIRTALKRFENFGFLANESTKQNRLISICNWETYQNSKDETGKATGSQPAKQPAVKPANESTKQNRLISICNWETYQNSKDETGKATGSQPAKQPATKENKREIENKDKKRFFDFVFLTDAEYKKLVSHFGKEGANERIENLNNYIGSRGRKYKNHYHTILTWERRNGEGKRKSKPTEKSKISDQLWDGKMFDTAKSAAAM